MVTKNRNFRGCWTCRARKVKCDLQLPFCQRCKKASLNCGGYDISLGWCDLLTISPENNSLISIPCPRSEEETRNMNLLNRRSIDFATFPDNQKIETYQEMTDFLGHLDDEVANGNFSAQVGPLSVFLQSTDSKKDPSEKLILKRRRSGSPVGERKDMPKRKESWIDSELLASAKLTTLAIKGPHYKLNEQNMLHILYPKFFANVDSDEWLPGIQVANAFFGVSTNTGDIQVTKLFSNFLLLFKKLPLSFIRAPIDHNYWGTLVTPYIFHIIFEFLCLSLESWDSISRKPTEESSLKEVKNNLKVILIYLVTSLSAFEKSDKCVKTPAYERYSAHMDENLEQSIHLRKLSINLLNYHLDEYDNHMSDSTYEYDTLLLLCIILQVEIDNCFGVFENFELLFAIAEFMLDRTFLCTEKLLHTAQYLIVLFQIMDLMFKSTHLSSFNDASRDSTYPDLDHYAATTNAKKGGTLCEKNFADLQPGRTHTDSRDLQSPDSRFRVTVDFNDRSVPLIRKPLQITAQSVLQHQAEPLFEPTTSLSPGFDKEAIFLMYGIPSSLLFLLHTTISLASSVRNQHLLTDPMSSARLEESAINWDVCSIWRLRIGDSSSPFLLDFHRGLYHYSLAFKNALLVYFQRFVKLSPPSSYQELVHAVIVHLGEVLQINKLLPGHASFMPSFWPVLICGADLLNAAGQKLLMTLWSAREFSHFNHWRAKQLVYELWQRGRHHELVSWRELVEEWELILCLI